MKKTTLLTLLLLLSISSCKKEPEKEEIKDVEMISLNSLPKRFYINDEILVLHGNNFIQEGCTTEIIINRDNHTQFTVVSNTEITIPVSSLQLKSNTIKVKVGNSDIIRLSDERNIYVITRWQKIDLQTTTIDILKVKTFEDNEMILYSYSQHNFGSAYMRKVLPDASFQSIGCRRNVVNDFDMTNPNTVTCVRSYNGEIYFSTDQLNTASTPVSFSAYNASFNDYSKNTTFAEGSSFYISNGYGDYIYTTDNWQTHHYTPHESYMRNGSTSRVSIYNSVKGENGNFYDLGILIKGTNQYCKFIRESTDYEHWTVIDSTSVVSSLFEMKNLKFYDRNLTLRVFNSELSISTDLTQTWTSVKQNVSNAFIRSRNVWYIISDNKIFVTHNAGNTWEHELDLPPNSYVTTMCFTDTKIVVGGRDGLFYVKHE